MTMIKNTKPAVTTVTLVDDLDETVTKNVKTIEFVIDGEKRVIDLGTANRKLFKDTLAPFVKASRIKPTAAKASSEAAAMRAWAQANGFTDLPARGRLPQAVHEAFAARNDAPAVADTTPDVAEQDGTADTGE